MLCPGTLEAAEPRMDDGEEAAMHAGKKSNVLFMEGRDVRTLLVLCQRNYNGVIESKRDKPGKGK